MDPEALRGVGESIVRAPVIRHGAAECYHPAQDIDLVFQCLFGLAIQCGGSRLERDDELVAPLSQQLDRVGVQKLIIAERRRYRATAARVFEARLGIVGPIAPGLEYVNANNLL